MCIFIYIYICIRIRYIIYHYIHAHNIPIIIQLPFDTLRFYACELSSQETKSVIDGGAWKGPKGICLEGSSQDLVQWLITMVIVETPP